MTEPDPQPELSPRDAAIARLLKIAKESVEMYEGEWGCGHRFDAALALPSCDAHIDAAEIAKLEAALR